MLLGGCCECLAPPRGEATAEEDDIKDEATRKKDGVVEGRAKKEEEEDKVRAE